MAKREGSCRACLAEQSGPASDGTRAPPKRLKAGQMMEPCGHQPSTRSHSLSPLPPPRYPHPEQQHKHSPLPPPMAPSRSRCNQPPEKKTKIIPAICWIPKGAFKNVRFATEPPTKEEIGEALRASVALDQR
ncbi:hypothetical protein HU200_053170 [Digitaria exilis]|uniref:Uncharacterized protein n=1 Tax=Digitaria exilis TaxID=1010633 RepID=A0A835ARU3_9POAL|nr:hypothetical protein HU200_053170 [Digitaria exilis]